MNINTNLVMVPIATPDAESRIRDSWRVLAEMIWVLVEGERDNKEIPAVGIPLVSDFVSSPSKNTLIINE